MEWTCRSCKISIPLEDTARIRKHIATKKHKRLGRACPRCGSTRPMTSIPGEFWDQDGIRNAEKCVRCKTEFKSYASGLDEKDDSREYSGELPDWLIEKDKVAFHELATSRGYVLKKTRKA